jgi:hypothetical protein
MTAEDLVRLYPHIPWYEPVIIHRSDTGIERYGCRICIALDGLAGKDVPDLPETPDEWIEHMAIVHGA